MGSVIDVSTLRDDLRSIGVAPGATLVVHSSLSAIGWVSGGAGAVIEALIAAVGGDGTLAMPAATPGCREFDRRHTPTAMGAIPEAFRAWPETLRSDHPHESVCARGPAAGEVTAEHPLEFSEGPGSPFGKLHDLDATILLLGVGFNRCTALHYAETVAAKRRVATVRLPQREHDRTRWVEVSNVADDNGVHFPIIGRRFVAAGHGRSGTIGEARSALVSMRELVTFAKDYFAAEL